MVLRYLFLTSSYRKSMNFTWESLKGAQTAYKNLQAQIRQLADQITTRTNLSEEKLKKVNKFRQEFTDSINNDLNIPSALAVLWEVVKSNIPPGDKYDLILLFDEVLGLDLNKLKVKSEKSKVSEEIKELVEKREKLRQGKKWDEGDQIRQQIEKSGFTIEDTPEGTKISRR